MGKPLSTDLNLGDWKKDKHGTWRLRLKDKNLLVGQSHDYGPNEKKMFVQAQIGSNSSTCEGMWIPRTADVNLIHAAWEKSMQTFFNKIFK